MVWKGSSGPPFFLGCFLKLERIIISKTWLNVCFDTYSNKMVNIPPAFFDWHTQSILVDQATQMGHPTTNEGAIAVTTLQDANEFAIGALRCEFSRIGSKAIVERCRDTSAMTRH